MRIAVSKVAIKWLPRSLKTYTILTCAYNNEVKNKVIVDEFFQILWVVVIPITRCSILTAVPTRHKFKLSLTSLVQ